MKTRKIIEEVNDLKQGMKEQDFERMVLFSRNRVHPDTIKWITEKRWLNKINKILRMLLAKEVEEAGR